MLATFRTKFLRITRNPIPANKQALRAYLVNFIRRIARKSKFDLPRWRWMQRQVFWNIVDLRFLPNIVALLPQMRRWTAFAESRKPPLFPLSNVHKMFFDMASWLSSVLHCRSKPLIWFTIMNGLCFKCLANWITQAKWHLCVLGGMWMIYQIKIKKMQFSFFLSLPSVHLLTVIEMWLCISAILVQAGWRAQIGFVHNQLAKQVRAKPGPLWK